MGPPFVGQGDERESTYLMSCNRNKESVTADLTSDEGKQFLRRLVCQADRLMKNFRPGVLEARLDEVDVAVVHAAEDD